MFIKILPRRLHWEKEILPIFRHSLHRFHLHHSTQHGIQIHLNSWQSELFDSKQNFLSLRSHSIYLRVGELISQPSNEKLLGLALASALCKPLRYCVQTEVKPSVSYWNFHSQSVREAKNVAAVVIVDSSNPVLAISRVASSLLSRGQ